MKYLTEEDVKWKGRDYYISLKSKWNDDRYGESWQRKYAGKPSVGAMVYLCNKWKPTSYEHFYELYISDTVSPSKDPRYRGRTIDELEDIAINWREDAKDYETPLSEYFDAIILHTVVETFVGDDFEQRAIKGFEENGYSIEHGTDEEDSSMNIDFKVYKDCKMVCLIQVKPLSFITGTRTHTWKDRMNAFEKHTKGNEKYPGIPYYYLVYDATTIKWVYNFEKKRCTFKYEELVNPYGKPTKSRDKFKEHEVDELFREFD